MLRMQALVKALQCVMLCGQEGSTQPSLFAQRVVLCMLWEGKLIVQMLQD